MDQKSYLYNQQFSNQTIGKTDPNKNNQGNFYPGDTDEIFINRYRVLKKNK